MAKSHAEFMKKFIPQDQQAAVKRRSDAIVLSTLSSGAIRVLERMKEAEGHWLSNADARSNRDAVCELQDAIMVSPGMLHGRDGYSLTTKGRNWTETK